MPRSCRLAAVVGLAALVVAPPGGAQTTRPPPTGPATRPALPRLLLGALLPLESPAPWYAQDMRTGMELAIADLSPKPAPPAPATGGAGPGADAPPAAAGRDEPAAIGTTQPGTEPAAPGDVPAAGPPGPALRFQLALEVLGVHPRNLREAATDFGKLAAAGSPLVFTASATPTLAVYPLAASRDVLLVHLGLPTARFPPSSRTLVQARPSVAARTGVLAAHAWARGLRRLGLVASGDEFGQTVRAALSARWREHKMSLVAEESLTLDAPDVRSRLVRLARQRPEAIVLGFHGRDLGELARRVREAGYGGLLLALDDDRAALLAAGPGLSDLEILSDAFVPEPDTRGARFATAFEARLRRPPSHFAASAYDVVSLVARSAQRAMEDGRDLPRGGAALREMILAVRTFPSVYGGQMSVRDDGSLDRPLALFAVERGHPTFLRYVGSSGRAVTDR